MSVEDAERWCDAWEIEAASRGLPKDGDCWQLGAAWIVQKRAARRPGWAQDDLTIGDRRLPCFASTRALRRQHRLERAEELVRGCHS